MQITVVCRPRKPIPGGRVSNPGTQPKRFVRSVKENDPMRIRITVLVATILSLLCSAPAAVSAQDSAGRYFFIFVHGVHTSDNAGYITRAIFYPGQEECGNVSWRTYERMARDAFNDYLRARHREVFPNGFLNNAQTLSTLQFSSGADLLRTRQQADVRLTAWIADQRRRNHSVVETNFRFSCAAI
jgi:hypothetical protein